MKYKVVNNDEQGWDVFTEDGGVTTIEKIEGVYRSTYYQRSLSDMEEGEDMWDYLAEGKAFVRDWHEHEPSKDDAVAIALHWLAPIINHHEWTLDDDMPLPIPIKTEPIWEDVVTELSVRIVNKLVENGLVKDCTDTDCDDEFDAQDIVAEILNEYFANAKSN
jgi:hypothetical protein